MKLHVTAYWRSTTTIDTNDLDERDYALMTTIDKSDLMQWPEAALEQVTTTGAELTDWTVVEH